MASLAVIIWSSAVLRLVARPQSLPVMVSMSLRTSCKVGALLAQHYSGSSGDWWCTRSYVFQQRRVRAHYIIVMISDNFDVGDVGHLITVIFEVA
jgi:hypothetical protein